MLGTFGTKKNKSVKVSKPTFQERLGGVKSMFKRAYEDALRLDTEMQASIDSKKQILILLLPLRKRQEILCLI